MEETLSGNIVFGDKGKNIGILPYQRRTHNALSKDSVHIVLAIWGFSGGKTYQGAREVVKYALLNPGGLIWILVPSYDVGQPVWSEVKKVLYGMGEGFIKSHSESTVSSSRIVLITGSVITTKTADDPDLLRNFTVNFLFVEEAERVGVDAWMVAASRVSKTAGKIFISATQPKDADHWIEELRDSKDPSVVVVDNITTKDNKALSKEQIKMFYSLFKGIYLRRDLEGERIFNTGAVYDCFKEAEHTFQNFTPVEYTKILSAENRIYVATDYGWDNPTGVLIALYCKWPEQETLFILGELYGRIWSLEKLKNQIQDKENEIFEEYKELKDYMLFRTGDPKQPDKIFEMNKMGMKTEVAPFAFYGKEYKEATMKEVYNWIFDNKIYVKRDLANLLMEFRRYVRKSSGSPIDKWDHLLDCLRQIVIMILIQNRLNPDGAVKKSWQASIVEPINWKGNFG